VTQENLVPAESAAEEEGSQSDEQALRARSQLLAVFGLFTALGRVAKDEDIHAVPFADMDSLIETWPIVRGYYEQFGQMVADFEATMEAYRLAREYDL